MSKDSRFCPDCGSRDVGPDTRRTNLLGEMIFNQNKWMCNNCGYTGLMPEGDPDQEYEDEELEFQEEDETESRDMVDTDAGKGYLKYVMYVSVPASILYVLYAVLI